MRRLTLISSSAVVVALGTLLACGGVPEQGDEFDPQDPQTGGLEGAPGEAPEGDEAGDDSQGNGPSLTPKVTICHIPPGNPSAAHTITVGVPALKAHLKHGDTLGDCGGGGEVDAGTGGGEVDAGTGGGEADAGTGGGDVDAGPPACVPADGACGDGVSCCSGLSCSAEGICEPVIN